MARRVAVDASRRLEVATLQAFAPAAGSTAAGAQSGRSLVERLLREQRAAERCRCRTTLPAGGFFRLDIADGALDVAMTDSAKPLASGRHSALVEIARAEAAAANAGVESPIHLRADSSLGDDVAVTSVVRDAAGRPTGVIGLIASKRALIAWMFAIPAAGDSRMRPDSEGELARLDGLSLEVRGVDGVRLLGALDPGRPFRATVAPRGAIDGLVVTVALAADQIAPPLIAPIAVRQLWHLGLLLLCTVLVIGIAVRSSRREALLARARSDFIAGVSHELRMPLAQILLASETLTMQRERDEPERLTLVNSILREARRLIALVENVLLFSRTGAVELRPQLQPVPVADLLADVVEAVQLAVDDVGQSIETDTMPMLAVTGDRTLLRQALVNLVDNAMKYGTAGQRIRLIVERSSPDLARLIVEDDGRGVPHAERARVFEPYERLARDQTSERTGTGLGLAVVREIVSACRGRVWLEATPGGGTRAVIELAALVLPQPAPPPPVVA